MKKREINFGIGIGGIVAIILILILVCSIRIVNAGEVGVLLQLGEVKGVLYEGFNLVIPFISDVKTLSVQIEKYESTESSASKDLQIVTTDVAVNYKLNDNEESVETIYRKFRGNHEMRIIQPIVHEAVKSSTAQFTAEELITKRTQVKTAIADNLKTKLAEYGIEVAEVSLTNLEFSTEFNNAIEQKVKAEQEKLKMQIDLDMKKIEVQKQIADADAKKQSEILKAEGDAQAKLLRAGAEAEAVKLVSSALSEAYSQEGYLQLRYIDKWNGYLPTVLGTDNVMVWMDKPEPEQKETETEIITLPLEVGEALEIGG